MSTKRIRQELIQHLRTVAWNFRQTWTAEQTGEVGCLDVDPSITTEDDFGFVTEDFVKPTAEGRHFINGRSHQPKTTFMSIVF